MPSNRQIVLPDLLSSCPFDWSVHPDYERARAESAAWIESFGVFADSRSALFNIYNFELLMALTYPDTGYDEVRTCCDCNNMLFVFDELSDHLGREEVHELGGVLLKALGGESTHGSVLSKIAGEFRMRFIAKASPKCQERFLARCADYIHAVSKETELREDGHVLQLDSYAILRRENSGVQPFFALIEYAHGIDLPDEVFENEVFKRLYWRGVDLVWLSNDLYSFSAERAKGLDGNNFLSVVMREKGMDMQEAADFTGNEIVLRVNQFLEGQKELPSFGGGVDNDVHKYIFSVAKWYIGNLVWSFETPRYFGAERDEVKKTLVVNVKNHGHDIDSEINEKYSG